MRLFSEQIKKEKCASPNNFERLIYARMETQPDRFEKYFKICDKEEKMDMAKTVTALVENKTFKRGRI